jgi:hypothetical protein
MAETASAVTGDGSVTVQSPQSDPTPKSDVGKDSEPSAPKPKGRKGSTITSKQTAPELGAQGRVKTQWDNPKADPNKRKHIGEDPDGTENAKTVE